jgi:PIN domain nuclease of toxin-antitoxin system
LIFDASAVLAAVREEAGADVVNAALDDGAISAVNWLEVLASVLRGPEHEMAALERIRLTLLPFDGALALRASGLLAVHRGRLSLGDCACIATAAALGRPVLTADRIWATLDLPVEVRLIR